MRSIVNLRAIIFLRERLGHKGQSEKRTWVLVTIVLVGITFFVARIGTLSNREVLNPDEAALIAWGMRGDESLVPFKAVVTNTSGPVWVLFLGVLERLGFSMNLVTAHFLSMAFAAVTVVVLLLSLAKVADRRLALTVGTLATAVWSTGGQFASWGNDILALSTESLPLLLVAIAILVFVRNGPTIVVGLLLGSAVASKYQVGLLCLILLTYIIHVRGAHSARRLLAIEVIKSGLLLAVPLCALTIWGLVGGAASAQIQESLSAPFNYVGSGRIDSQVSLLGRIVEALNLPIKEPFTFVFFLFSAVVAVTRERSDRETVRTSLSPTFLLLVSTLATLSITSPIFVHYYQIPIFSGITALVLECKERRNHAIQDTVIRHGDRTRSVSLVVTLSISAIMLLPNVSSLGKSPGPNYQALFDDDRVVFDGTVSEQARKLLAICPPGSHVTIWGWSPELYSYFGWRPSTPFVETSMLMGRNFETLHSRGIFVDALRTEPPECLIEALGHQFFGNFDVQEHSLVNLLPQLSDLVNNDYEKILITSPGTNDLSVFVLRKSNG